MLRRLAPLFLLFLLAGCSSPDPEAEPGPSLTIVTDPSQGRADPTMGEHLHDYWGKSTRKVVVDATIPVGTFSSSPDARAYAAAEALPEPGDVVPQGTATVEVTMTWTPNPELAAANQVAGTRLAIRTAADREALDMGPISSGQTFVFASSNEKNDLPHQVLSAWEFQWILEPVMVANYGHAWYQGEVAVHVEAVRGLEIPLYPGHPDQWLGRSEIDLFTAEGTVIMDGDPRTGNMRCYYTSCPARMVPGDGVVVPIDAHHVRVTLDRDTPMPTRLGLAYHTAVSREWQVAQPVEESATHRIYSIDVLDGGDGAYTKQSTWEFALFVEEPVEDGYIVDSYRVSATVHRDPMAA